MVELTPPLNNELIREKTNRILDFLLFWGRPIRVGDLVKEIQIKHTTLNSVLHKLSEEKLIIWKSYGPVELTEAGRDYAAHLSNHHFIIEEFIRRTLDLTEQDTHQEALHLSGAVSCELIEAICRKYNISHENTNTQYCLRNRKP